jgi:hypothetical protein
MRKTMRIRFSCADHPAEIVVMSFGKLEHKLPQNSHDTGIFASFRLERGVFMSMTPVTFNRTK